MRIARFGILCAAAEGRTEHAQVQTGKGLKASVGIRRFNQLCDESQHAEGLKTCDQKRMFCDVCKQRPAAWDRDSLKDWLKIPCRP